MIEILGGGIGIAAILVFGMFVMFTKWYRKVEQGKALIINTMRSEPEVTFTGRMVYPVIHKAELMDISLKTIEIKRSGKEGLICQDNIRADIQVTFFVRVNKTAEDVLKVAQAVGCERASEQEAVEELFAAKFSEALKTVGKLMDFVDLYQQRDNFRDAIIKAIGNDLNGYVLEDAAIDFLEQTPIADLDTNNILDAQGIRKIVELTALEHIKTNELQRDEQMRIKKKDVETREAILELERQQADAEAKQQREIASVRAREKAETDKVASEEKLKSETARIRTEQDVSVQEENKQREVEVAQANRKRAVAIEEEKVTRARELEIVDREREVELQKIEKEKSLEAERRNIAEIVRERIMVDRTVAEQEEAIKEVRTVSEADRTRQASVITAEAEAEEARVKAVKEAEAKKQAAEFKAAEQIALAEAQLQVSAKEAQAKKLQAEGIEALEAASGLAEAKVVREKMAAEAEGKERVGLAEVKVKLSNVEAVQKEGDAEAHVIREKLVAEAEGQEKLGLAAVQVKLSDAAAVQKQGEADAIVIKQRFMAESEGLREKFEAMQAMSPETRAHEEYRLSLDQRHAENMKSIDANMEIAREQAKVISTALGNAKLEIVGGDGDYFNRFVRGLGIGKAIDGAMDKSETLQKVLEPHLNGERDLVTDLKSLMQSFPAQEIQNLTVSAFLAKAMAEGNADQRGLVQRLQNALTQK